MNIQEIQPFIERFVQAMTSDAFISDHNQVHQARSETARTLLTLEHIPALTRDELEPFLTSLDTWYGARNRDEFVKNVFGDNNENLDRTKRWLTALVTWGSRGLTAENFSNLVSKIAQVGPSWTSEILALRFPDRYWLSNGPVNRFLKEHGVDVQAELPPGHKGDKGLAYIALGQHISEIREVLGKALGRPVDYLLTDLFMYWTSITLPTLSIWWVNQGSTYAYEQAVGFLWAPLKASSGATLQHWENLSELRVGDVIVHHAEGSIRALSRVTAAAVEARKPQSVGSLFLEQGRLVEAEYYVLKHPIPLDEVSDQLMTLHIPGGPLTQAGGAKQGYLWRFTKEGLAILREASLDTWPEWAFPTPVSAQEIKIVTRFDEVLHALEVQGLYFSAEQVANYLLALQSKRFVILTGISGTGKTRLATSIAEVFRGTLKTVSVAEPPTGAVTVYARPYTFKEKIMNLPQELTHKVPIDALKPVIRPNGKQTKSYEIEVVYPGGKALLALYKNTSKQKTMHLVLKEDFWDWFSQNLKQDDPFLLSLSLPSGNQPTQLHFSLPTDTQVGSIETPLDNYALVAVRPDWTDNRGLLGYYNPLTDTYHRTPLLDLLLRAQQEESRAASEGRVPYPFFVILDEMNLARVEHYFSDFLSCLESDEPLHLHDEPSLEVEETDDREPVPCRLCIPKNVFFTGTVNVDETTYMFSPKVLDRAFTVELNHVDLRAYGNQGNHSLDNANDPLHLTQLPHWLVPYQKPCLADWAGFGQLMDGGLQRAVLPLHDLLADHQRHFGYRVAAEIARYVVLASQQTAGSPEALKAALDLAILQKVLPKFHGTQQELELVLKRLLGFAIVGLNAGNSAIIDDTKWHLNAGRLMPIEPSGTSPELYLPRTAAKLWRMLERLHDQGFTSFIE